MKNVQFAKLRNNSMDVLSYPLSVDARHVALKRQHLQIEHQVDMIFEVLGDTEGPRAALPWRRIPFAKEDSSSLTRTASHARISLRTKRFSHAASDRNS